jgi:tetraacyldisaccharide 4'-kinase
MKLSKPKFWDKKNSLNSLILIPFTLIILLIIFFKKKFTKSEKFNIPVICVGNIYIGGTGKTPTSIYLASELAKINKNPVILRKYYKSHVDEHNLIRKNFKNLILDHNRVNGLAKAIKNNYDSVILDDGLQDYKIKKDISIVCFHQNQLIGNGLVLPAGPLRENLNSLKNADIVLINGKKKIEFEKKILYINKNLKIFYSQYRPININQFKNKKLLAIAAIGNPINFFNLIKENNLNIKEELTFPDHYQFTKLEILNIIKKASAKNYQIVMTEKDYFKIKDFNLNKIEYLRVALEINEKEKFIKTITRIYD